MLSKEVEMKKIIFWIGLILLILGLFLFFISGSTSGPNLEPTIPFIYGTNQLCWIALGLVGLIITLVGVFKKRK